MNNPFTGKKVLIIGDICIDRYIEGRTTRKSPESDAMIFRKFRSHTKLGMSGNVAKNVQALGGIPTVVSVIGQKGPYKRIIKHLELAKISFHLVFDNKRKTTVKSRIQDGKTNILRIDEEDTEYISFFHQNQLLTLIQRHVYDTDIVVFQDYGKGVLYKKIIQETIAHAREWGKKVIIDPSKSTPIEWYRGADMITPNTEEAIKLSNSKNVFSAAVVLRQYGINTVAITMGENGILLSNHDTLACCPTAKQIPVDVTGAGDTVVAVLALGESINLSIEDSIELANKAAGIVIQKSGVATCTFSEII